MHGLVQGVLPINGNYCGGGVGDGLNSHTSSPSISNQIGQNPSVPTDSCVFCDNVMIEGLFFICCIKSYNI